MTLHNIVAASPDTAEMNHIAIVFHRTVWLFDVSAGQFVTVKQVSFGSMSDLGHEAHLATPLRVALRGTALRALLG